MALSFCHSMPLLISAAAATAPSSSVTAPPRPGVGAGGAGAAAGPTAGAPTDAAAGAAMGAAVGAGGRSLGGTELMRPILSRPPHPPAPDGIPARCQSPLRGPLRRCAALVGHHNLPRAARCLDLARQPVAAVA